MTLIELTEVLGNVGEFLGAIAVVVTLFLFIIQLRQGKKALDANTKSLDKHNKLRNSEAWDRLNTEVLEWNKIFVENEDICSIWLSGEEEMTELPVTERMRYQHLFNMILYTHQSAYNRAKMLDNEEMADHAIESFADTLKIEGGTMQIWKHYNQTDEFGEKINEYLKTIAT